MTTLETRIMNACKWEDPQLAGTLLYHIEKAGEQPVADIVCVRNDSTIGLTWISPDLTRNSNQIQLVVDRKTDQISANMSDAEFLQPEKIEQFLKLVEKSIAYEAGTFLPEQPLDLDQPETRRKNRMI